MWVLVLLRSTFLKSTWAVSGGCSFFFVRVCPLVKSWPVLRSNARKLYLGEVSCSASLWAALDEELLLFELSLPLGLNFVCEFELNWPPCCCIDKWCSPLACWNLIKKVFLINSLKFFIFLFLFTFLDELLSLRSC